MDRGVWTAKTVKRPRQPPAQPQYANYWAPLTRKRHILSHPAQPQHANYWASRTRKRHQQEHRPQRPTERSDPTQHAKGRTGDRPRPRKETTTRRNVTRGGVSGYVFLCPLSHRLQSCVMWCRLPHAFRSSGCPSATGPFAQGAWGQFWGVTPTRSCGSACAAWRHPHHHRTRQTTRRVMGRWWIRYSGIFVCGTVD